MTLPQDTGNIIIPGLAAGREKFWTLESDKTEKINCNKILENTVKQWTGGYITMKHATLRPREDAKNNTCRSR